MRDPRTGQLRLEGLPLKRLGLEDWTELAQMQTEAQQLIRQHRDAELDVMRLEQGRSEARERDLEAHAKALRGGAKPPKPKHEPELERQLEAAAWNRDALEHAAMEAMTEIERYKAEHAPELRVAGLQALQDKAQQLASHAQQAAQLYGQLLEGERELARLTPPEPDPDMSQQPAQHTQMVIGGGVQSAAMLQGPQRGEVEQALAHLASLQDRFITPEPQLEPEPEPELAETER